MPLPIEPEYVASTLPDDLLAAIGSVIYKWGRIEYQLSNLIAIGFDLPKETGRALTIGMEVNVMCGVIRTLTFNDHWIKDDALCSEIKILAADVQDKSGDRHDYAHGVMGYNLDEPNTFARYLFKAAAHRIAPSSEKITAEGVRKIAGEANE